MNDRFFSESEIRRAEAMRDDSVRDVRLFIYGAGAIGGAVWAILRGMGIRAEAFLDDNPTTINTIKEGLPVLASKALSQEDSSTTVVIAVGSQAPVALMERCRRDFACNFLSLKDYLACIGLSDAMIRMNHNAAATDALQLWADAQSLETYRKLMRYRVTFDDADLPSFSSDQYFNSTVIRPEYLRSFVDGGAYEGDTLDAFLTLTNREFDNYYAFEPLPEVYDKMCLIAGDDDRIQKFPAAISNAKGVLRLSNVMSAGAKLDPDGVASGDSFNVAVDCLDSALAGQPVTMIKMDIEGEELRALEGAKEIIRRNRPALAICTYHLPEHLWQVPAWIAGLDMGYELRTLHHGPYHTESVCYAT